MWERRYDAIIVSDESQAQWARLKYSLSHGVKEGLVERVTDWPGIHAARHLVYGEPLEGAWFNRSKEWAARNRGQAYGTYDYATRYAIPFVPLPAFRHLAPEEYQDRIAGLIGEIEAEGEKKRDGNTVAGVEKILSQNPLEPPTRVTQRSPKPLFHVASKEARDDLIGGFLGFQAQYQIASASLRDGNLEAAGWFPEGCYPPALSFIGPPSPKRRPWPPTRQNRKPDSGPVERGEIPLVEIGSPIAPKARGQPP